MKLQQCHMFGRSHILYTQEHFLWFTVLLNLYFAQCKILITATNILRSIRYSYIVVILICWG